MKKLLLLMVFLLMLLPSSKAYAYEEPVAGMSVVIDSIETNEIDEAMDKVIFSNHELQVLYRIVEAEATGCSMEAKKNIASVIINRVHNREFPDRISDAVFQRVRGYYQFSPILDGRYWEVEVIKETVQAVNDVIGNGVTTKALYFTVIDQISQKNRSWFNNLEYLFTDDSGTSYFK